MQALCGLQGIFDLFNCKTPVFLIYSTVKLPRQPFFCRLFALLEKYGIIVRYLCQRAAKDAVCLRKMMRA